MNMESKQLAPTNLPPRINRLREQFLKTKPSLSIHRAKAFTQIFKEFPGTPLVLLRAMAIEQTAKNLPLFIDKDELIVGHPGGKKRAGIISPDVCYRWIEKELESVHLRPQDPYFISEEDKKTLKNDIFPFWRGRSVDEVIAQEMSIVGILPITYESGVVDCEVKTGSGGADLAPGFHNILFSKGFLGIKEDAEKQLLSLRMDKPEDIDKIYFLRSITKVCDAMILLGKRYALLAREQGRLDIAAICERVPALPPRNFHEALQMIWFGQVSIYLEENTAGTSPGRVDQYVFPYLKKDLEAGNLNEEQAEEILYSFLLKFNEIPWPLSEGGSYYFAGYIPFFNIVVGGQNKEGQDATNMLSMMILDCVKKLRMYQPSLAARIHRNTPKAFLDEVVDVISMGLGFPALHFDEVTIPMLVGRGIPEEEARDYCIMGCVEPYVAGKLFRWTSAVYTNFPVAIEFALNEGKLLSMGKQLGCLSKALVSYLSFEDFEFAVKEQLKHIIQVSAIASLVAQRAHRDHLPKPMSSALVEGCIEKSTEIMHGGALYNSGPGIVMVGVADYANSMMAIKQLVFDEKKFTLQEVATALIANFVGFEDIEKACLEVAKYGNDIDEVDFFARDVIDFCAGEINNYRGLYGKMELGTLSVTTNLAQGKAIGALPSGRKAGLPLADGISPAQGTDLKGPTASIKSVDKINQVSTSVGTLFNMKLHPDLLNTDQGRNNVIALIRSHNRLGGAQIQFNCVTKELLIEAQKNPEKYRSLIVRVSGYSAYFTELCKEVQQDIINRTEQSSF